MYNSITDISEIKVGHATNKTAKTGCTVIICGKEGMSCGIDVRGGSPGTRDTALLAPSTKITRVHAITLTGGSAYGLDAAGGVMEYLEENEIGYSTGGVIVPIVPAAVIFDLVIGDKDVRPDKKMGYKAAASAEGGIFKTGSVGVGTGATVGKFKGMKYCMKSGLGTASMKAGDLIVSALVVTNSLGNIVNPHNNKIIAGVKDKQGNYIKFEGFNCDEMVNCNTTLAVVASNAKLNKSENSRVATMAHDGYARTIKPVHTMYDGDVIFSIASGNVKADINRIGLMAVEVVEQAVINSVKLGRSDINESI